MRAPSGTHSAIQSNQYGNRGPVVILLHGGPGTPGYLGPLARELADTFRVIEPFQRGSGGAPLTVARHVEDLHDVVCSMGSARPALVGHSWGAMLALAYGAAHPEGMSSIALIGCGTFDTTARAQLMTIRGQRITSGLRLALDSLSLSIPDPGRRLQAMGDLLMRIYSFDPIVESLDLAACDADAYEQSWSDMLRLQEDGIYPAAFARIKAPIIMLHGADDPHPGAMIRDNLAPHLPRLEYREWERCGHYPWLERHARDSFLPFLKRWLSWRAAGNSGGAIL